jgi:hypothetical protein
MALNILSKISDILILEDPSSQLKIKHIRQKSI